MLDFLPPATRKKIYQGLASLNAVVAAVVPILVLTGVITQSLSSEIISIAASVLSAAGFILAAGNTNVGGSIDSDSSSN